MATLHTLRGHHLSTDRCLGICHLPKVIWDAQIIHPPLYQNPLSSLIQLDLTALSSALTATFIKNQEGVVIVAYTWLYIIA